MARSALTEYSNYVTVHRNRHRGHFEWENVFGIFRNDQLEKFYMRIEPVQRIDEVLDNVASHLGPAWVLAAIGCVSPARWDFSQLLVMARDQVPWFICEAYRTQRAAEFLSDFTSAQIWIERRPTNYGEVGALVRSSCATLTCH